MAQPQSGESNRSYGKIRRAIWRDTDWTSMPMLAQWMYQALLSQESINAAGVLPLTDRRWSKLAVDMTRDKIEEALEALADRGYIVVDWDTEEVLVRTFIRNDGLWTQPSVMRHALQCASQIQSPRLRAAIAIELARLAPMVAQGKASGVPAAAFAEVSEATFRTAEHLGWTGPKPDITSGNPDQSLGNPRDELGKSSPVVVAGYVLTEDSNHNYNQQLQTAPATAQDDPPGDQPAPAPAVTGQKASAPKSRSKQAPPHGWRLVRDELDAKALPGATLTELAIRAAALLDEDQDPLDIRAALRRWNESPGKGPGLLPHLLADIIRERTAPSAALARHVPGSAASTTNQRVAAGLALAAKYESGELT